MKIAGLLLCAVFVMACMKATVFAEDENAQVSELTVTIAKADVVFTPPQIIERFRFDLRENMRGENSVLCAAVHDPAEREQQFLLSAEPARLRPGRDRGTGTLSHPAGLGRTVLFFIVQYP